MNEQIFITSMHMKDRRQMILACMPFHFTVIHNLDATILENSLVFKMLNVNLQCDPTVLPTEMYPREMRAYVYINTCMLM